MQVMTRQGDNPNRREFNALVERVEQLEKLLAELQPKPRGRPKNGHDTEAEAARDS